MLCHKYASNTALFVVLVFGSSVQAVPIVDSQLAAEQAACAPREALSEQVRVSLHEPLASYGVGVIPESGRSGPIMRLRCGRGVAGVWEPALLYENDDRVYTGIRIPDESSPPYWLADDIELVLPVGAAEWEITAYDYLSYAYGGTAPYDVRSALYRFDACTSSPTPLVDWYTGQCCADPVEIAGTGTDVTITSDGYAHVTYDLSVPVNVPKECFMHLTYSGANVAGNAGWIVAGPAEIGFTDDFWIEDVEGDCGLYSFGGDPYGGFMATVWGKSAAVMDMIPEAADGAHVIVGNEVFLDCHDLPQCVQIGVYARDWDPDDLGVKIKGHQNRLNCDSYSTAPEGTLVASIDDCSPGPCDLCTLGADKTRPDYVFPGADFQAC